MANVEVPFGYAGGKASHAPHLLPRIPRTERYVEVYGGSGAILIAKPRVKYEVFNDLNDNIATFFRVLQDEDKYAMLHDRLKLTPYSRSFYLEARAKYRGETPTWDEVDKAWACIVTLCQAFSGKVTHNSGGWSFGSDGPQNWERRKQILDRVAERFRLVEIECADALNVIPQYDKPSTTYYLDPPYVLNTRSDALYLVEQDDDHHRKLVNTLLKVEGSVTMSGYASDLYTPLLEAGWVAEAYGKRMTMASSTIRELNRKRVETVYLNPRALDLLGQRTLW